LKRTTERTEETESRSGGRSWCKEKQTTDQKDEEDKKASVEPALTQIMIRAIRGSKQTEGRPEFTKQP